MRTYLVIGLLFLGGAAQAERTEVRASRTTVSKSRALPNGMVVRSSTTRDRSGNLLSKHTRADVGAKTYINEKTRNPATGEATSLRISIDRYGAGSTQQQRTVAADGTVAVSERVRTAEGVHTTSLDALDSSRLNRSLTSPNGR